MLMATVQITAVAASLLMLVAMMWRQLWNRNISKYAYDNQRAKVLWNHLLHTKIDTRTSTVMLEDPGKIRNASAQVIAM